MDSKNEGQQRITPFRLSPIQAALRPRAGAGPADAATHSRSQSSILTASPGKHEAGNMAGDCPVVGRCAGKAGFVLRGHWLRPIDNSDTTPLIFIGFSRLWEDSIWTSV